MFRDSVPASPSSFIPAGNSKETGPFPPLLSLGSLASFSVPAAFRFYPSSSFWSRQPCVTQDRPLELTAVMGLYPGLRGWRKGGPLNWNRVLPGPPGSGRSLLTSHTVDRVGRSFPPSSILQAPMLISAINTGKGGWGCVGSLRGCLPSPPALLGVELPAERPSLSLPPGLKD